MVYEEREIRGRKRMGEEERKRGEGERERKSVCERREIHLFYRFSF